MFGFINRFLNRRAQGAQATPPQADAQVVAGHSGKPLLGRILARPRLSTVPGAIVRSRARRAMPGGAARHAAAASASSRPRAFWISVDPQDIRRTAMAGTPSEVCEVLEQLLAMQTNQQSGGQSPSLAA